MVVSSSALETHLSDTNWCRGGILSVMGIFRQSAPEPLRYTVIPSGKNRARQRLTQRIHTSAQDRKAKTKSAMALVIHRVEILKPQVKLS